MKVLKNKRIVVFEINDNIESRKYEHSGRNSGSNYKKPFADFIESLGFEVVLQDHIDAIEINGERFDIYLGNASYMTKNAWSRDVSVRKPINRYVSIMRGYDSTLLKIHFNKEYDGDKLCKTINDEIQSRIDAKKFHEDNKNRDKKNTIAIAEHLMDKFKAFKAIVHSIQIKEGNIQMNIDNVASLTVTTKGKFVIFDIHSHEIKNENELDELFKKINFVKMNLPTLTNILKKNPLDGKLIEWAEKAYNRYYDVKKLKYSEH